MPLTFTCPHCEFETLIDPRYAGQTGRCRNCGRIIAVPQIAETEPWRESPSPRAASGSVLRVVLAITIALAAAAAVALVAILFVALSMTPVLQSVRQKTDLARCSSNLATIAHAMLDYEAEHGTLPPPYLADQNGAPGHSWRVLLLPYLGEEALYSQYDFAQPWNSPMNLLVANQMPSVYGCPLDSSATAANETSYLVIVGSQTPFSGPTGTSRRQFGDDPRSTILVVEVFDSGVMWTQPVDFPLAALDPNVNGSKTSSIRSHHEKGAHAAMADGSVVLLGNATSGDVIRAMTTANGGENVSPDDVAAP